MDSLLCAFSSLKVAGELAKGLLELKTLSDVQGKVIELQGVILSAQERVFAANAKQAALVEEKSALEKKIADMEEWGKEQQRYDLVAPAVGILCYAVKKECAVSEPPHWICANCYEDGRKSILNFVRNKDNSFWRIVCPACGLRMDTMYRSAFSLQYAEDVCVE